MAELAAVCARHEDVHIVRLTDFSDSIPLASAYDRS
jgi:hypothetical protein